MITISLTPEQATAMREILTGYHNTLLLELSKADSREFRDLLRNREVVVTAVLDQLMPIVKAS